MSRAGADPQATPRRVGIGTMKHLAALPRTRSTVRRSDPGGRWLRACPAAGPLRFQGLRMARFLRSKRLRAALWAAADGKCQGCGCDLPDGWHADHTVPYSVSGRTNVHEMQALCPKCNLLKGSTMLRRHQSDLLATLQRMPAELLARKKSITAHVWPGGGKSALPVIAGHVLMRRQFVQKIMTVVPRLALKRQGAEAFLDPTFRSLLGHQLEIRESCNDINPDRGTTGYITTYDAVRENPGLHVDFCRKYRTLLVLDEVHHVGEGSPTLKALGPCWTEAVFCLALTGTLDRHNSERVAFFDYEPEEIGGKLTPVVDIRYGLRDAIAERAIIPIEFFHHDGQVTYVDRTGQKVWLGTLAAGEEDCRDGVHAALASEYADQLLSRCVAHWQSWRLNHPRSLLLVVCASIKQAKRVLAQLQAASVESAVATSEDSTEAQEVIRRYRAMGKPAALVTVAMAYEGMDVRAITHIACLTHIRSFPWLMQMFGRATRFDPEAGPWDRQKAFVFAPDDPLMQQAVEYVRNEQVIGVEELAPPDDEGSNGGAGGSSFPTPQPAAGVVPIDGCVSRVRATGIGHDGALGYEDTAKIEAMMAEENIHGSVLNMASLLKKCGVDLSAIPAKAPNPPPPGATAGEREKRLRTCIEDILRRLDRHTGSDFGTWNQRCFREAQRMRKRDTLTETELTHVWRWVCEQAGRQGLEVGEP